MQKEVYGDKIGNYHHSIKYRAIIIGSKGGLSIYPFV
jgi:hypothetical protein